MYCVPCCCPSAARTCIMSCSSASTCWASCRLWESIASRALLLICTAVLSLHTSARSKFTSVLRKKSSCVPHSSVRGKSSLVPDLHAHVDGWHQPQPATSFDVSVIFSQLDPKRVEKMIHDDQGSQYLPSRAEHAGWHAGWQASRSAKQGRKPMNCSQDVKCRSSSIGRQMTVALTQVNSRVNLRIAREEDGRAALAMIEPDTTVQVRQCRNGSQVLNSMF